MPGPVVSTPLLQRTPLHALHLELGARMVPFAGYEMPVQYPAGLMAEHRQCRERAALFDVSHMGQIRLQAPDLADAARALERLVPADLLGLAPGQQRYGFFTNARGGLLDDLMVTRRPGPPGTASSADTGKGSGGHGDLMVIVNAACKAADLAHLQAHLNTDLPAGSGTGAPASPVGGAPRCHVELLDSLALLALQGPLAVTALARLAPGVAALGFLTGGWFRLLGHHCFLTRSGYTGEDGFEISVPADHAETLARALLAQPEVAPAGLGARDTLRLEAGLCLYGHDIGPDTTPVEAALAWALPPVRRVGGVRAGGYPGAEVIDHQLVQGPPRRRVGLVGTERVPVREGALIVDGAGAELGTVSSGTLAPTVNAAIAMARLPLSHTALGTEVHAVVRGKRVPMRVTALPFVPRRYVRV
jgi:aminomethyltransferase